MESVHLLNPFLDILEEDYPGILREAAEVQARINADQMTLSSGMVYDIEQLPDNEEAEAFRARILRLGLQGTPPKQPVTYEDEDDFDVIDTVGVV